MRRILLARYLLCPQEAAGENAVSEYAIGQETAAAEDEADRLLAGEDAP